MLEQFTSFHKLESAPQTNAVAPSGMPKEWWALFAEYLSWIDTLDLSKHTRRSYKSRIGHFLRFASQYCSVQQLKSNPGSHIQLTQLYLTSLTSEDNRSPRSINNAMTTIDHLYKFMGLRKCELPRLECSVPATRYLSKAEQKRLLLEISNRHSARDRAIMHLFLNTGIRLRECMALNLSDLHLDTSSGSIVIGEPDQGGSEQAVEPHRISLNYQCRKSLSIWLSQRHTKHDENALFLSFDGRRLSVAAIDYIVRSIGWQANLELCASILRKTHQQNIVTLAEDSQAQWNDTDMPQFVASELQIIP